jgi:hypothetical protein
MAGFFIIMKNTGLISIILFLLTGLTASQSRTNLEVFYDLVDSSVSMLPEDIKEKKAAVYAGSNILLQNYIFNKLRQRYGEISVSEKDSDISYAVENIKLEYGEIFRKKFLGDYYIERNFLLKGNAVSTGSLNTIDFNLVYRDTVKFDNVAELENNLHPFTKAPLPAEPFLQGIIEPVVAIGAAATAVILFFIIRSK